MKLTTILKELNKPILVYQKQDKNLYYWDKFPNIVLKKDIRFGTNSFNVEFESGDKYALIKYLDKHNIEYGFGIERMYIPNKYIQII